MSAREEMLARLRRSLGAGGEDPSRRKAVARRLAQAPKGPIPARGQLAPAARVALFCEGAAKAAASVERLSGREDVPEAVTRYLRARNLPLRLRMGDDPRLAAMPWGAEPALEIGRGASDGSDEVGLSHAFAGVAESGTVLLHSGGDNPTTLNFLPDHHIVVVDESDVEGDLEAVLARLRARFGKGALPRTLNLVTGPSRSGDIELTMLLGAHGPRALHILVVGEAAEAES